jgi:hypothetical protein
MTDDLTTPSDPLSLLSDQQLFDTQLSVALACGRAKGSLRDKHRTRFCFLLSVLTVEAQKRGRPSPQPPYSA